MKVGAFSFSPASKIRDSSSVRKLSTTLMLDKHVSLLSAPLTVAVKIRSHHHCIGKIWGTLWCKSVRFFERVHICLSQTNHWLLEDGINRSEGFSRQRQTCGSFVSIEPWQRQDRDSSWLAVRALASRPCPGFRARAQPDSQEHSPTANWNTGKHRVSDSSFANWKTGLYILRCLAGGKQIKWWRS